MREVACQFGEQGRLHGVVTSPDCPDVSAPMLVLVSAGLMAKAGPYRLYTQIARDLAGKGICTLRFDLGGIGNSEQIDPSLPLIERTRIDIHDAVEYVVQTFGPAGVVLAGLCSGAEDSFRYAADDARVHGVILIDPHAYVTAGWYMRRIFSRHFLNRVVYKFLRVARMIDLGEEGMRGSQAEGFEGDLINYQYMNRDEAGSILSKLIACGTRFHYIYTGGLIDRFNHRRQFYRMFDGVDFRGLETVTHLPTIEHVQVFDEDRRLLIDTISGWISHELSPGQTASATHR